MRYSKLFPKTIKEAPSEEVSLNAKLLLRAGFIDKLMAGSYSLLPLGRLVERKIEQIIREEMDRTGAQEVLMPLLHPKSIWNETGRWDSAKEVMYQFQKDDKEYALSFTHEEIVLDLVRKHVQTYRDFPVKIYHFSTKFRNELRAKSGILRGREFLMKDLYSLHESEEDLDKYYWEVKDAYLKVFKRLGLDVVVAEAGGGVFTDSNTHEFQVISPSGEDKIYYKDGWEYWKNKEVMTEEELKDPTVRSESAIEVGNIFRFGTVYSEKMDVSFTDKNGEKQYPYFGSYGIGLTRMVGVLAELFNDEKGIIWPENVAPFQVHLISLNHEGRSMNYAKEVYTKLNEAGVEVLYDDREISAGEKFNDADLIGIPVRVVVSDRLEDGQIEIKKRTETDSKVTTIEEFISKFNS
jgi:prolyl-tRNA synthetase